MKSNENTEKQKSIWVTREEKSKIFTFHFKPRRFLGCVDMLGKAYEGACLATGYGNYLAVVSLKTSLSFYFLFKFYRDNFEFKSQS